MADIDATASVFVVIGGGVSGVSCCQYLAESDGRAIIILIAPKDIVKLVTNHRRVTRTLEEFDVEERPSVMLSEKYPNVRVINEYVTEIRHRGKFFPVYYSVPKADFSEQGTYQIGAWNESLFHSCYAVLFTR